MTAVVVIELISSTIWPILQDIGLILSMDNGNKGTTVVDSEGNCATKGAGTSGSESIYT